jgi:hypothetical protein
MASPTWLTISQAQKQLYLSKSYYARLCRTGGLVCQLVGNTYLIDPKSFDAFLIRRRTEQNMPKRRK